MNNPEADAQSSKPQQVFEKNRAEGVKRNRPGQSHMIPTRASVQRAGHRVPYVHSNRNQAVDRTSDYGQPNAAPVARRVRQRIGKSGRTISQQSRETDGDYREHQRPGERCRLIAQRKVHQKNIQEKLDGDERQRQGDEENRRTSPKWPNHRKDKMLVTALRIQLVAVSAEY